MSNRNSEVEAVAVILILVALAVVVWVSRQFGVDFATSVQMCARWIGVCAVYFGGLFLAKQSSFDDSFNFGRTWQLFGGGLWWGFWPALDYWAQQEVPTFLAQEVSSPWYSAWYFKGAVLVALVVGGWFFNRWVRDEEPFGYGY